MLYLPSMELEQRGMEQKQSRVGRGGSHPFLLGKGFLVRLHHFVAGQSILRVSVSMHVQLCRILLAKPDTVDFSMHLSLVIQCP